MAAPKTQTDPAAPTPTAADRPLRFAVPKGRMHQGVVKLLEEAAIRLQVEPRGYRATVSLPNTELKILKPQDTVAMLAAGSRDLGFAGADWVRELGVELVELVDTGMDPVKLVAAAPSALLVDGKLPDQPLVVASEYENITRQWIEQRGLEATFVRSYGATEVFPPEDADCIVDNTATGSTLRANQLDIVDTLMRSSTRLYASPRAMDDPGLRAQIEDIALLLRSVTEARRRVMLEVNVGADDLERLIEVLPCMREPTVSRLHGEGGYAVKSAVPRAELPLLIPQLKARGGSDVVVTDINQIVP